MPPPESRAVRRANRHDRVAARFDDASVKAALDLLELVELAWHDCYGDVTPSESVVDDILLVSQGTLAGLISAAHLAVIDWRDREVAADTRRRDSP